MTNIAVYIDGTWNDPTDDEPTNVLNMHNATKGKSIYISGVGNEQEFGWFGRAIGGATGAGADAKVSEALEKLSPLYKSKKQRHKRLFIVGFSRGAAIARLLAQKIGKDGINGHPIDGIEFLGCFDTVASFGIPGNQINLFKDMHVSHCVKNAYHAVAIHEKRLMFPPTLMNHKPNVTEVWFRGAHSDIGGGYKDCRLSDVTLEWMMDKAKSHGLEFNPIDTNPDHSAPPHTHSWWRTIGGKRKPHVLVNDKPSTVLKPKIYAP